MAAENKIIQQTIPGYTYSVAPTDIGSGYAKGITEAGQSIAGAIRGVMGGIDAQGNVQQGIIGQNQSVNDMLQFLSTAKDAQGNPVLPQDAYESIMSKGLGARQQALGMYLGMFQENYKNQIDQASKLAQIQAQGDQAVRERMLAEQGASQRQAQQTELERQKLLLEKQPIKIVNPPPPAGNQNPPNTNTSTLQLGLLPSQNKPSVLNKPFSLSG